MLSNNSANSNILFTLDQIKAIHSKVKSGVDFPDFIQNLKSLGITQYETFVTDGHTDYYGLNDYKISSPGMYKLLTVCTAANAGQFITRLKAHQQGKTDFQTFCMDSAKYGVEKWMVSIDKMTCTYYDKNANEILKEIIPTTKTKP